MKGHASTWIEGDGTVRTVFRTMALYAYSSEEKAKDKVNFVLRLALAKKWAAKNATMTKKIETMEKEANNWQ